MNDYAEPVCCETPMLRHDDRDLYGREYYYFVCMQCGEYTNEERIETEG